MASPITEMHTSTAAPDQDPASTQFSLELDAEEAITFIVGPHSVTAGVHTHPKHGRTELRATDLDRLIRRLAELRALLPGIPDLTVHVVIVWPKSGRPVPGAADTIKPHSIMTWMGLSENDSAHQAALEFAVMHEILGWPIDQRTFPVSMTSASPAETAVAMTLHDLGFRNSGHLSALRTSPVEEDLARSVSPDTAATYLDRVHELQVDIDTHDGYDLVVLRLARRAIHGDPFAILALNGIRDEAALAARTDVPANTDPLTFATPGDER